MNCKDAPNSVNKEIDLLILLDCAEGLTLYKNECLYQQKKKMLNILRFTVFTEWYIIELRFFYGYLISSMFFLMIAEINGINKQAFPQDKSA
jgi:hypothetical protein